MAHPKRKQGTFKSLSLCPKTKFELALKPTVN